MDDTRPSFTNANCIECGLCSGCITPFMDGDGPINRPVLIVGEAPGESEDERGTPFVGDSGRLLRTTLRDAGIDLNTVRFTNAVRCRPPDNKLRSKKHAKLCKPFLLDEIERVKPRAILCVGGTASDSILGRPTIGKNRLTNFYEQHGIPCSIAYHPAYVLRDMNELPKFKDDIRFFYTHILGVGKEHAGFSDSKLITNPTEKQIRTFVANVLKNNRPIAFDFETSSLKPYLEADKFIVMCCAISDGRTSIILRFDEAGKGDASTRQNATTPHFKVALWALTALLTHKGLVKYAHNAKYDMHVANVRFGLTVSPPVICTEALHATLEPVRAGHDLDSASCQILKCAKHKGIIENFVGRGEGNQKKYTFVPPDLLYQYAALDSLKTALIGNKMWTRLSVVNAQKFRLKVKESNLPFGIDLVQRFKKLVIPAVYSLQRVEARGIRVDLAYLNELENSLVHDIANALKKLKALRGVAAYIKEKRKSVIREKKATLKSPTRERLLAAAKKVEFNPNSNDQIRAMLFDVYNGETLLAKVATAGYSVELPKTETGLLQTGTEVRSTLCALSDKDSELYIFCTLVDEYQSKSKLLSTYVRGLRENVDANGYVHADFRIPGTVTGRLSCKEPNLQNIPREEVDGVNIIRKIFIPDKGEYLVDADYSQIELRVLAAYSGDKMMIDAFKNGQDIHDATARKIFNIQNGTNVEKEQRVAAKGVNFGVVYGESEYGLSRALGIDVDAAAAIISGFFMAYPHVRDSQDAIITFGKKHGYVPTPTGSWRFLQNLKIPPVTKDARRLISEACRQAVNTPIQGAASDIALYALISLDRLKHKYNLPFRILSIVHDSILFSVRKDALLKTARIIKRVMEHAGERLVGKAFLNGVPILVDIAYGDSWGELKKLELQGSK